MAATAEPVGAPDAVDAARRRRRELHAVLVQVERAIARPAPGRAGEWLARVSGEIATLRASFGDHVDGTEGAGGLFERVLQSAPRLSSSVGHLRDEHDELSEAITEAQELLGEPAGRTPDEHVAEVRTLVLALLGRMARHRQLGSDLVYEAFEVDVGGVD